MKVINQLKFGDVIIISRSGKNGRSRRIEVKLALTDKLATLHQGIIIEDIIKKLSKMKRVRKEILTGIEAWNGE